MNQPTQAELDNLKIRLDASRKLRKAVKQYDEANPHTPPSVPLWEHIVELGKRADREDQS